MNSRIKAGQIVGAGNENILYAPVFRPLRTVAQNLALSFWSDTIKPHTQGDIMNSRKGVIDGAEINGRI